MLSVVAWRRQPVEGRGEHLIAEDLAPVRPRGTTGIAPA